MEKGKIAFIIHGGAGNIHSELLTEELNLRYKEKVTEVIKKGYEILSNGGSSIDAVEAAINIMENCSLFDAGKGSVINDDGEVSMDSSIMDGTLHKAGAVAGVKTVKYPISLARKVMDNTQHVMLIGSGAEEFAKSQEIEIVGKEYFTEEPKYWLVLDAEDAHKGTVGAVGLDCKGNISAGTSTGGTRKKKPGRVGDSPIIGAGTYADSKVCGVSCTGVGEYFMRAVAAYSVAAMKEYQNITIHEAIKKTLTERIHSIGGEGGIIAIDNKGNIGFDHNTPGMIVGYIKDDGIPHIKF